MSFIFKDCVTIDGNYLILQDNLFSIKEQKFIGNIWESIDYFKILFNNVKSEEKEYQIICENLNNLPILENNNSLIGLKNILLEFNFLQDTWLGQEFSKSSNNINDFVKNSYEGLKKFGLAISQGEWQNILNLIGKGVKYILRSLKSALYSNTGIIVDSILIAMNIGKAFQFVPWALVTMLDVYQFYTNDYVEETSTFMKIFDFTFDVIGMVSSGYLAQSTKKLFEPIKQLGNNEKLIYNYIAKNKKIQNIIKYILKIINKVPSFITKTIEIIGDKFKKISDFIKKYSGKLVSLINYVKSYLSKFIGKKGADIVTGVGGTTSVLYGVEKGKENILNKKKENLFDKINNSGIKPEFNYEDI